jgi:N-methylhydantoinase A
LYLLDGTAHGNRQIGVDVGGTFTDLVMWDGAEITTGKVSSTPDQSEGVIAGATALTGGGGASQFLHGTTVATNALLERKGARVALVTTEGFTDVLEIGRQDRPALYDPTVERPVPLVAVEDRTGVPRNGDGFDGAVSSAAEAVAVCLLYGYQQSATEEHIAEAIRSRRDVVAISLSSRVAPEFREFERTSTTVLNAYLMPEVARYLENLVRRSAAAGLPADIAVMRSSGGLMSASDAATLPAAILLSGPAGGVVASAALGTAHGKRQLVSFDMGGTSTDVCRIDDGLPEVSYSREIAGYPCLMPSVAIHTVGAGGGSIAWMDAGGSLRVGPQSSGAQPGPAGYGRGGTAATVTDANIVLGRIDPCGMLAGALAVRPDLAERALAGLGGPLGMAETEVAVGVTRVVEEVMAGAIRRVSIEQGADPRSASLVAFGGAGGLHATALARRLDMAGVIIPAHAGVFSALGLLLSPPRVDAARTVMLGSDEVEVLDRETEAVRRGARAGLEKASGTGGAVTSLVDVRYRGQSHEVTVPYAAGDGWALLAGRFHQLHAERNGFARPDDPIEAVTVRAEAAGVPALRWSELPAPIPAGDAVIGEREVMTADGLVSARVYRRAGLAPGDVVTGPAIVEETEATTFLDGSERGVVLDDGAIEVEW